MSSAVVESAPLSMQTPPESPQTDSSTANVVVACCHGKERVDLSATEFEHTVALVAARHSGKGQCCLGYLSGSCRNGTSCPHLHPKWNHVLRLNWVATPSGPSAAMLASTPGAASVTVLVRRTNRSYDVPQDEFYPTEHLSVAVRLGSGTACSHHLRETCMNGESCRFLHPSDRMLLRAMREELSVGHPVLTRAFAFVSPAIDQRSAHKRNETSPFTMSASVPGGPIRPSPSRSSMALPGALRNGIMPPPVIASDDDNEEADQLLGLVHTHRARDLGCSPENPPDGAAGSFKVEAIEDEACSSVADKAVGQSGRGPQAVEWSPLINLSIPAGNAAQPKQCSPSLTWSTPSLRPAAQPFTPGMSSVSSKPPGDTSLAPPSFDLFDVFAATQHHPLWTAPPAYDAYHSSSAPPRGSTPLLAGGAPTPPELPASIAVTVESKAVYTLDAKDFDVTRNLAATIRIGSGIACSHHLRDRCNNGSTCRFLHPNDAVLVSLLRSELGKNHPLLSPTSATVSTPRATPLQNPSNAAVEPEPTTYNSEIDHGSDHAASAEQLLPPPTPPSTTSTTSPGTASQRPLAPAQARLPKPKSVASAETAADAARAVRDAALPLLDRECAVPPPTGAWATNGSAKAPAPLKKTSLDVVDASSSNDTMHCSAPVGGRGWETVPRTPDAVTNSDEPAATHKQIASKDMPKPPDGRTSVRAVLGAWIDVLRQLRSEGHVFAPVRDVVLRVKGPLPPAPEIAALLKRGVKEGILTERSADTAGWCIGLAEAGRSSTTPVAGDAPVAAAPSPSPPPDDTPSDTYITTSKTTGKDVTMFFTNNALDANGLSVVRLMQHDCDNACDHCLQPLWKRYVNLEPCHHRFCGVCAFAKLARGKKSAVACPVCAATPKKISVADSDESMSAAIDLMVMRCLKCGWKGPFESRAEHSCHQRPVAASIAIEAVEELLEAALYEKAVEETQRASDGAPPWATKPPPKAIAHLMGLQAKAHNALGKVEVARVTADAGLKLDQSSSECLLQKAVALAQQGKHGQAVSALHKTLAIDQQNTTAQSLLSRVMQAKSASADVDSATNSTNQAKGSPTTKQQESSATAEVSPSTPQQQQQQQSKKASAKKPIEKLHQFVMLSVDCAKRNDYGGVVESLSNAFALFHVLDRRGRSVLLTRRAIAYYRLKRMRRARADLKRASDLNNTVPAPWVLITQLSTLFRENVPAHQVLAIDLSDVAGEIMFPTLPRAELRAMFPPESAQQLDALMENELGLPFNVSEYARKTPANSMIDGTWSDQEDSSSAGVKRGVAIATTSAATAVNDASMNPFSALRRIPPALDTQLEFEADMFHGENAVPMSPQLQNEFTMLQCKTPPSVDNLRHLYRLISLSCIAWTLMHYQNLGGLPPESVDLENVNVEVYWAKAVERFKYFFRQAVRRRILPKWFMYEAARDAHLGILNRLSHVIDVSRVHLLPPCYVEFAHLVLYDLPEASRMLPGA